MALVELKNVYRSFRKGEETITPLNDVTLEIHEGDFVSLMGPSGTGKSTLELERFQHRRWRNP